MSEPILSRLTRIPPEPGAVRSYSCVRGRFIISLWSRGKRTAENAWTMHDLETDARTQHWNRKEAIRQVVDILTFSRFQNSRFLILRRLPNALAREDCVLYDRLTRRWWWRKLDETIHRDVEIMEKLAS